MKNAVVLVGREREPRWEDKGLCASLRLTNLIHLLDKSTHVPH